MDILSTCLPLDTSHSCQLGFWIRVSPTLTQSCFPAFRLVCFPLVGRLLSLCSPPDVAFCFICCLIVVHLLSVHVPLWLISRCVLSGVYMVSGLTSSCRTVVVAPLCSIRFSVVVLWSNCSSCPTVVDSSWCFLSLQIFHGGSVVKL